MTHPTPREAAKVVPANWDLSWDIFQLSPVSLWLEDLSGVRAVLEGWRGQGVTDVRAYINADPQRMAQCFREVRVLDVNRRTLDLFEARDLDHLLTHAADVFRSDGLPPRCDDIEALWNGRRHFASRTVNYTLSGRRLDVVTQGRILPGYEQDWRRVLVVVEDVTDREEALRQQAASEAYARGLFQQSPVSLWVTDFSGVKTLLDELRAMGIADLRRHLDQHPQFAERCLAAVVLLDVNRHSLQLFNAPDLHALVRHLADTNGPQRRRYFADLLADLWQGSLMRQSEIACLTVDGAELYLQSQFSILPGHEADWSLVQMAMTDITNRKKSESYLTFLSSHDVLTKLRNRAFYNDETHRLEDRNVYPVTIVVADLNGLKEINDTEGHAAGDALLARAGDLLSRVVETPASVSRLGGDEFAILLPGMGPDTGTSLVAAIKHLAASDNRCHGAEAPLSFAMGHATREAGEPLQWTERRADQAMYAAKRQHYARHGQRRVRIASIAAALPPSA